MKISSARIRPSTVWYVVLLALPVAQGLMMTWFSIASAAVFGAAPEWAWAGPVGAALGLVAGLLGGVVEPRLRRRIPLLMFLGFTVCTWAVVMLPEAPELVHGLLVLLGLSVAAQALVALRRIQDA